MTRQHLSEAYAYPRARQINRTRRKTGGRVVHCIGPLDTVVLIKRSSSPFGCRRRRHSGGRKNGMKWDRRTQREDSSLCKQCIVRGTKARIVPRLCSWTKIPRLKIPISTLSVMHALMLSLNKTRLCGLCATSLFLYALFSVSLYFVFAPCI